MLKIIRTVVFTVLLGLLIALSTLTIAGSKQNTSIYAQNESDNPESEKMKNMNTENGTSGNIPSMSTPGEKTFYIFTSEVENVDADKLKVGGDSFSIHTIVANKGDKVTVYFYNVDDVKTERHSFTIGDPYKVDIDLGFAENGNATFTADQNGVFTYYCKYHSPFMVGQLVVLP